MSLETNDTDALFASGCQSFLDNIVAGFALFASGCQSFLDNIVAGFKRSEQLIFGHVLHCGII
jgi:hypothetical protein